MKNPLALFLALGLSFHLHAAPGDGDNFGRPFHAGQYVDLTTPYGQQALEKLLRNLSLPPIVGGQAPRIVVLDGHNSAYMAADGTVGVSRRLLESLSGQAIDPKSQRSMNGALYKVLHDPRAASSLEMIVNHEIGHYAANDAGDPQRRPDRLQQAIAERRQVLRETFDREALRQVHDGIRAEAARRPDEFDLHAATRRRDPSRASRLPVDMNGFEPRAVVRSHLNEFYADQHAVLMRFQRTGDIAGSFDFYSQAPKYSHQFNGTHPSMPARYLRAIKYIQQYPEVYAAALQKPVTLRPPWAGAGKITLQYLAGDIHTLGFAEHVVKLHPSEYLMLQEVRRGQDVYRARVAQPGSGLQPTPESQIMRPASRPSPAPRNAPRAAAPARGPHAAFADPPPGRVSTPRRPGTPRVGGTALSLASGVLITAGTQAGDQLLRTGRVDLAEIGRTMGSTGFWRSMGGGLAGSVIGGLIPGGPVIKLAAAVIGGSLGAGLASGEKQDWWRIGVGTAGSLAGSALLSWMPGGVVIGGIVGGLVAGWLYDQYQEWKNRPRHPVTGPVASATGMSILGLRPAGGAVRAP